MLFQHNVHGIKYHLTLLEDRNTIFSLVDSSCSNALDTLCQRVQSDLQSSFLSRRSSYNGVTVVDVNTSVCLLTFGKVLSKVLSNIATFINNLRKISSSRKDHLLDFCMTEGVFSLFESLVSNAVDCFFKILFDVLVTTSDSSHGRLSQDRNIRLSLSIA